MERNIYTFVNNSFVGFRTLAEVTELESKARDLARDAMNAKQADHAVYSERGYRADGKLGCIAVFSDKTFTDKEFAEFKENHGEGKIRAIHRGE